MFTDPYQNIIKLGLSEGMKVADFGAGAGFVVKALSDKVGYTGKVFAIDVQKDMVKRLENEIKFWGIKNVECIWGDVEKIGGSKIADDSMDAIVLTNVLSQTEDKIGVISEIKRVLKKGGKVLFADLMNIKVGGFSRDNNLTKEKAIELFEKKGFVAESNISDSQTHYGIIFKYE